LFQLGSLAQGREIDRRAGKEDFPETRFLNVQFPSPRPLWNVGFLAEHSNANNHCKGADSGESAHNTRLYGNGGSETRASENASFVTGAELFVDGGSAQV
jgi:hypothetical protein